MQQIFTSKLYWLLFGAILLLGTSCTPTYTFNGTLLEPAMSIPEFELMRTDGEPFTSNDLQGKITLIYFGYTFCPDVCPLTIADVKTALNNLEIEQDQVQVVFVSVDPERDTPEILDNYLSAFDSSYIGLTDSLEKTEVAKSAFGVFSEKAEVEDSAADYLVNHTARLFLVNDQGEIALLYSFGFKPDELQSDLQHLLASS